MKNTTFRKKALLSSVAMLLVALVALGSATFAWFTSSTVATANGINVRTAKASKLEISKNDLVWGTLVDYKVSNKLLLPASSADGEAWYEADAAASNAYDPADGTVGTITDTGSYVVMDQLNIKNNGEANVNNVKITISGITNDYIRVALVPAAKGGPDAANTGTFADCVYDNAGTAYPAASGITTKTVGEGDDAKTVNIFTTTSITPKNTYVINVGELVGTKATEGTNVVYYNLYVWFEGQDAQCTDANAGQVVSGLEITVTGDTVVA